jgi:hypothetical protein
VQEINKYLRYQEPMNLNKKGHSAVFKNVTRNKVAHTMMGKSKPVHGDQAPPTGHYRPNYDYIHPTSVSATVTGKGLEIDQKVFESYLNR